MPEDVLAILEVVGMEVLPVPGMRREAVFSPRFGILFVSAGLPPERVRALIDEALAAAVSLA